VRAAINTTHIRRAATAIILIGVVLLAACGQQSQPKTAAKYGGTVTVVPEPVGSFSCTFNPFTSSSHNNNCYGIRGLIFEPLIYTNRLNNTSTPWLAQKYSWSPDALTLTMHLRQNVTWSDGTPFTSSDVAFTFDLLRRFPAIDENRVWHYIAKIATPDPSTVIFTFAKPSISLQWEIGTMTYIVPQHIWQNVSDPSTAIFANPIGTGPFVLSEFHPDLYVLKRNRSYWQPSKPYIDEVRFPAYSSDTGTSLLLVQGTLDWAGVYTESIQTTYVPIDPTHNHYWFPPSSDVVLALNQTRKPFQSTAVRQAISLAIDRNALVNKAESGYPTVAHPSGLVLPEFQSYLDPRYANLSYHQDIAQAQALLASAGYSEIKQNVLTDAAGNQLSFDFTIVDGWTNWTKAADLIAAQLSAIHIDVHVHRIPYADYYSQLQSGTFDMSLFTTETGPTPFYSFDSLDSRYSAPVGQTAASNWIRWNDPTTDGLLQQYREAFNTDEQQKAIRGLEQIMIEQSPIIPLYSSLLWTEYSTTRFIGWPDANNPYAAPSPTEEPDIEMVLLNIHIP
jgi:peptide/nickel transport system substrate-binding protein